ncbi:ligand-binding sensor domain-containing protein [Terriglobus tenax]|uniref:ligand-binding sensor domain-containing protein n=1 Tax=Terriglobus tenax TaxID=1111115 RepID=UPI0021E0DD8C|nr:ligand-binding sensor domain-containing diguanylate cyclase [Terriglobus tenax]
MGVFDFGVLAALVAGLVVLPSGVAAQRWESVADSVFKHPISDTTLPNSPVLAIAQDHDGFLWIGTEGGVARWDGYRYRIYQSDAKNPGSLPDNYIQSLHVDKRGNLWIATLSGGLSRYDRLNDRFINYSTGPGGLSSVDVLAITDDGKGGVWVATNQGLDDVDPERGVIGHLRHNDADSTSLPDNKVRAVLTDREGRLWIGTHSGAVRQDASGSPFVRVSLPGLQNQSSAVICMHEDASGRMWLGTTHGAYVVQPGSHSSVLVPRFVEASRAETVQSMAEGRPGEMWLGTYGNGILIVNEATFGVRNVRHDPLLPQSLDEDTVWAIFRDKVGDMWTGTNRGFSHNNPNQSAIMTVFGVLTRTKGLSDTDVESVLSMSNGQLWLGLGAKGVDILDPVAGRVGQMRLGIDGTGKTRELSEVRGLVSAGADEVYLCARSGLYRKTPQDAFPVRIELPGSNSVQAAAYLPQTRTVWIGTIGDGLWSIRSNEHGRVSAQHFEGSSKLADSRVSVITPGSAGSLWIGTYNGLDRLDPATGSIEHIRVEPETATAIAAPYVSSLMNDRQGRLWVGMQNGGISILEGRTPDGHPRFRHLGLPEGLPNLNVDKILQAPSGAVWAATDNGLAVIDPKQFTVRVLGEAEGGVIPSYWINAGATTADGVLAFGGAGGLSLVLPDNLKNYAYHPSIVVTDIRIGGKPEPWGRFGSGGAIGTIEISPDANSVTVEFAALDYSAPERNRYSYWLEGYDHTWNETDSRHRVAAYTNLPPGHYVLHLRGSNRDGIWTESQLSLPIRVLPTWYQTVWFKIAGLIALFGMGFLFVQTRTAYLRARQRELERQVASQTAELRKREHQLEQMAYSDPLTGLPNRRMFTEHFNQVSALMRRQEGKFALLLIDLDRFKQINDTLGHDAGDALLIEAASRLKAAVRESDHVFRLGGDEFAVLEVGFTEPSSVEMICRRITRSFEKLVTVNGASMNTSPSIGVATFPVDGESLEELYKIADMALYQAKGAGRNTWHWKGYPTSNSDDAPKSS